MSLVRFDSRKNSPARYALDPFAMARDLLAWDPYTGRTGAAFAPAFEVKETADAFVVHADLPGVREEDLDVSLHNGVLSISGSRTGQERTEGESYYVYERQYGAFARSFSLPDAADGDKVDAKLEGGVLTLTIGKRAEAKPRKIALRK